MPPLYSVLCFCFFRSFFRSLYFVVFSWFVFLSTSFSLFVCLSFSISIFLSLPTYLLTYPPKNISIYQSLYLPFLSLYLFLPFFYQVSRFFTSIIHIYTFPFPFRPSIIQKSSRAGKSQRPRGHENEKRKWNPLITRTRVDGWRGEGRLIFICIYNWLSTLAPNNCSPGHY